MPDLKHISKNTLLGRWMLQWKQSIVPYNVALRNTLSIILPLGICIWYGQTAIGMALASGAMNVVFADRPGPYRLRLERMLYASLGVSMAVFSGVMLGGHPLLLIPFMVVWAFCCAILVCLGPAATQVGAGGLIVFVIMAAFPTSFQDALGLAGLSFAGGCLATLFTIMAWPLHRYRPERNAVADIYRQLSELARARPSSKPTLPVTEALNEVQNLLLGRHHATGRAMEAFYVLVQQAERIRMELLVLLDQRGREGCPELNDILRQTAIVLRGVSVALYRGRSPQAAEEALKGFEAAVSRFDAACQNNDDPQAWGICQLASARVLGLTGPVRAAVRNANYAGSKGEERAFVKETKLPRSLQASNPISLLRANLSWSSVAFRHAVRCAICMVLAEAVAHYFALPQGYWVPMTAAVVLKPEFGNTFSFGMLRVVGTLAGVVIATAIMALSFTSPLQIVALIGVTYFAFRRLASVNYGLAVSMLTAAVVLLLALDGFPPEQAIFDRGVNTLIGSCIAMATYLMLPTWERGRERGMVADMLSAYGLYFQAVLSGDKRMCHEARVTARFRRTNVVASLERLRTEPNNTERVRHVEAIFATSLLYTRAAMAFEAAMNDHADRHIMRVPQLRDLGGAIVEAMLEMAWSIRENRVPVPAHDLRKSYRDLLKQFRDSGQDRDAHAVSFFDAADRTINAVNTLNHILTQHRTEMDEAAPEGASADTAMESGSALGVGKV